ncbi:MAG: CotH kinase family protein [Saprospiraceae bacterium]|nr:CotH kinase family protein [Saprospiraceae bacterium]
MPEKILLLFLLGFPLSLSAQSPALYDDRIVGAIYLELPADSLQQLIGTQENEHYYRARFIFDDGATRDTLDDAGLRLRGNTSLAAAKKSFKISFNEYAPGREYQGVRKLSLRAQHNDPTLVREKLFYEVWKKAGMPERRAAFVRLYINQQYRGLYTNIEELDKQWLGRTYPDNDGNLYKCTWPASLAYLGPNEQTYKNLLNNPEERAYDLKTNEEEDDYSRLVTLITVLNQPVDADYPAEISQILNVDQALKAYAIDVATGNWDDYFYLQNNYYLYDNPATGRFEFITYDTDNTFGIDWLNIDWARRNALEWHHPDMPRPLATQLLAVPAFREQYIRYLDTITRLIVLPDSIFPRIDSLHQLITPATVADVYRTLDYGYDVADFHNGFTQTIDSHTPYGIKPFLGLRGDSTLSQIAGLLSAAEEPGLSLPEVLVYPNPASDWLYVRFQPVFYPAPMCLSLYAATGQFSQSWVWDAPVAPLVVPLHELPEGVYFLHIEAAGQSRQQVLVKRKM